MTDKVSDVSIGAAGLGRISIHWDVPVSDSHANNAVACAVSPECYRRSLYEPTPERVEIVARALEWYAEQARLCRLIHSEGDAGRRALSNDGGKQARAALDEWRNP
jgi:hypothetical protein